MGTENTFEYFSKICFKHCIHVLSNLISVVIPKTINVCDCKQIILLALFHFSIFTNKILTNYFQLTYTFQNNICIDIQCNNTYVFRRYYMEHLMDWHKHPTILLTFEIPRLLQHTVMATNCNKLCSLMMQNTCFVVGEIALITLWSGSGHSMITLWSDNGHCMITLWSGSVTTYSSFGANHQQRW